MSENIPKDLYGAIVKLLLILTPILIVAVQLKAHGAETDSDYDVEYGSALGTDTAHAIGRHAVAAINFDFWTDVWPWGCEVYLDRCVHWINHKRPAS